MTLHIEVSAMNGKPHRTVVVNFPNGREHRDVVDINSATSRMRFWKDIAAKAGVDAGTLETDYAGRLYFLADEADAKINAEVARDSNDGDYRLNTATQIVVLARAAGAAFWTSPDGDGFATVQNGEHREHHRTASKAFRQWLSFLFFAKTGKAAGSQAVADAVNICEGQATFTGEQHPVWLRTAQHEGRIFLDIGDPNWRAIEIDATGWRLVDNPPVRFRRPKAMAAMPIPDENGDVHLLRKFLNVDVVGRQLILGWLVAALRPTGPYPVLALHGEQGTGKSTIAKLLRLLVDPNTGLVRRMPNEPRDLASLAMNSWVLAMDNVSTVPHWLSDAMCVLSTGGSFAARQLFTNDEENLFTATRPIVMNGITDFVDRSDLLDRTVSITLEPIRENDRRQDRLMMADFDRCRPKILGGLLDAVSTGLRRMDSVVVDGLPRLADFVVWAEACGNAFGWCDGDFTSLYADHRRQLNSVALESSAIAKLLLTHISSCGWTGSATELLDVVTSKASDDQRRAKDFPRTPQSMSGIVRRVAPNLRAAGLDVQFLRVQGERRIRFESTTAPKEYSGDSSSPSSPCHPLGDEGDEGDGFSPSYSHEQRPSPTF